MVEKFEKRLGYSPVRFLPCLTGRVIDSPEVSTRFLWDWRRLISESVATEYVGGLREISNKHGLTPWLENYGHWGFPSEFLLYGSMSDQVGGEFWESSEVKSHQSGKGAIHHGVDLGKVLGDLGVQPDVMVTSQDPLLCAAAGAGKIGIGDNGEIVFKHRSAPDREIYFLSNTTAKPVEFTASRRVAGRKPELWNADRGAIVDAAAFTQRAGRTQIPLRLNAAESIHVVFGEPLRPDAAGTANTNTPESAVTATLDGPWTVRFDGQGAPKETTFESLTDWTNHPDETIRHYAGTGIYETNFTLAEPAKNQRTVLELGEVAVIASVMVNGKQAGTAWTTPWEIDISDLVKSGNNTLQIRVTNQWHNRLVADASLPQDKRFTHSSEPYKAPNKDPFRKSGLLGPVRIKQSK